MFPPQRLTRLCTLSSGAFVLGFLPAALVPLLISGMSRDLAISPASAGLLGTELMLVAALAAGRSAGVPARWRPTAARAGLLCVVVGFGLPALWPTLLTVLAGCVTGGAGTGVVLGVGGGMVADTGDPRRATRLVGCSQVLAVLLLVCVPLPGDDMRAGFGALALVGLLVCGWPVDSPAPDPARHADDTRPADRRAWPLIVLVGVWALGEDTVWALAAVIAGDRVALAPRTVGMLLGAAVLLGVAALAVGTRLGDRRWSIVVLLAVDAGTKLVACWTGSAACFVVAVLGGGICYQLILARLLAGAGRPDRWVVLVSGALLASSCASAALGTELLVVLGPVGFGALVAGTDVLLLVPMTRLLHRRQGPPATGRPTRTERPGSDGWRIHTGFEDEPGYHASLS